MKCFSWIAQTTQSEHLSERAGWGGPGWSPAEDKDIYIYTYIYIYIYR